jgi:hypothetical protein
VYRSTDLPLVIPFADRVLSICIVLYCIVLYWTVLYCVYYSFDMPPQRRSGSQNRRNHVFCFLCRGRAGLSTSEEGGGVSSLLLCAVLCCAVAGFMCAVWGWGFSSCVFSYPTGQMVRGDAQDEVTERCFLRVMAVRERECVMECLVCQGSRFERRTRCGSCGFFFFRMFCRFFGGYA